MITITDPITGETVEVESLTVTCQVEGCENYGLPIVIPDVGGAVQCGPCRVWIIPPPIEPIEPEPAPEPEEVP